MPEFSQDLLYEASVGKYIALRNQGMTVKQLEEYVKDQEKITGSQAPEQVRAALMIAINEP